jgi:hypothetical protein
LAVLTLAAASYLWRWEVEVSPVSAPAADPARGYRESSRRRRWERRVSEGVNHRDYYTVVPDGDLPIHLITCDKGATLAVRELLSVYPQAYQRGGLMAQWAA